MENEPRLASAVRDLRWKLNETQREFARRIHVTETTVQKYETDVQVPKASVLKSLAELAKVQNQLAISDLFLRAYEDRVKTSKLARFEQQKRLAQVKDNQLLSKILETTRRQGSSRHHSPNDRSDYTHQALWTITTKNLITIEKNIESRSYIYIASVFLASHVFEAYVNYVSDTFSPRSWGRKDVNFSDRSSGGAVDKFKNLLKSIRIENQDTEQKLFACVLAIEDLRNQIVHPQAARQQLEDASNVQTLHHLLSDLEQCLERLHSQLRQHDKQGVLTPYALRVSTFSAKSESVLMNDEENSPSIGAKVQATDLK